MVKSSVILDSTDKNLLRRLQARGRATNAELAEAVHLSESACFRRVRVLETEGVITGYAANVSPAAVGLALTVYVSITLSSQAQDVLAAFERAVAEAPEIMECCLMTGQADYMIRLVASDVEDLERLHATLLTRLPGVARINSSIALRTVVRRTALPVR
ncbi:Lrp/AsnC family transcriptional regulator [Phenylobacterium aquaticum]|jgi:Lrp/AsnC family leucine-responsive transcriptional regulator|uniref:Lrp/AsnC family transcriptional regulator n=1 Tax=Phenylobacterium aquaticum TaxID=1763816 RepID=UPI001F5D848C|nr:Lrp/AsnC family transcriptional regulator [Phenylobacterium aquaticum]MCI3131575.1 Lrp/AsnC family transcriptional regulator [Phenylobacterium aquaticum]